MLELAEIYIAAGDVGKQPAQCGVLAVLGGVLQAHYSVNCVTSKLFKIVTHSAFDVIGTRKHATVDIFDLVPSEDQLQVRVLGPCRPVDAFLCRLLQLSVVFGCLDILFHKIEFRLQLVEFDTWDTVHSA